MDLLVVFGANIIVLSNASHIANHERSHACLLQRGDKSARLLVLDLADLVLDLLELFLLGADDALVPLASLLHLAVDAAIEPGLQLVTVLHLGAQQAPVQDVRGLPVMRYRHVDLAQVHSGGLSWWEGAVERRLCVGGDSFVLAARPADDQRLGQVPIPWQEEWCVATPIREAKTPVFKVHSRAFVFDPEVPLPFVWGSCVRVFLTPLSPAFEGREKGFHTGIRRMGVKRARGEEQLEVLLLEKDPFVPDGAPEEDERLCIELAALMRQLIQLCCFAVPDAVDSKATHIAQFFLSAPKTVEISARGLKPERNTPCLRLV